MPLSFLEIKQVAELRNNLGFIILLDSIQSKIDDLSNQLTTATPDKEAQLLAKWRATREIFTDLKYKPEEFAMALAEEKETSEKLVGPTLERTFDPHVPQLTPNQVLKLRSVYDRKKKDLDTIVL